MSTIAVNAITDANGGNTTSINNTTPNAYNTVGKNLIINGAMQIAQRGTSSTSTGYTTVDRWTSFLSNSTLSVTVSQSTDAPDGFSNSFKWETTAGATLNTNTILGVQQWVEAQALQQLGYGTTSAKKLTLSFWVKSSVTGTFAVSFYEDDDSRMIGSTYTINTANTWEKKSITIDGDTVGVIDNDNGRGLKPIFHIASGSDFTSTDNTSWGAYSGGKWGYGHVTNTLATSTGTWQLTGVQLEVGESATEFEHRPYTTEYQLCQRYLENIGVDTAAAIWSSYGATVNYLNWQFKVEKRVIPTISGAVLGTAGGSYVTHALRYTNGSAYASFGYNGSSYSPVYADAEL